MNINNASLRDYILTNISQEDIFANLFNINVCIIEYAIINRQKIANPLRGDTNPSMQFEYKKGKLRVRDYGNAFYTGDIFDIASIKLNKNSNVPNDFVEICNYIIRTIPLKKDKTNSIVNTIKKDTVSTIKDTHDFTKIDIYNRDWNSLDYDYWKIPANFLTSKNVYPLMAHELNGKYVNDYNKLGYAYFVIRNRFNLPLYKLYFPHGQSKFKFISNNNLPFDELIKQSSKDLVFIKSKKDSIVLSYLFAVLGYTVDVIALSSEAIILEPAVVNYYTNKYDRIFTFFDYDLRGVKTGFIYKHCYGTIPIYIGRDSSIIKINDTDVKELDRLFDDRSLTFEINDLENFIAKYSGDYTEKDLFDLYKRDGAMAINFIKKHSNDYQFDNSKNNE